MPELPDRVRTVLDALAVLARPIILTECGPNSCIASTRVGVDVLAYFGVPAKPVPVSLVIFNAEALAVYAQTQDMDAVRAAALMIPAEVVGGAWTIGVGVPGDSRILGNNDWPGHLVIGLRQYGAIVDLSLDQAARPLKNIAAKPSWYPVPETWWTDPQPRPAVLAGESGTQMLLRRTGNESFRLSPNWKPVNSRQRRLLRSMTGQVIAAMRAHGLDPTRE